jgi:hypothetical protein
MHRRYHRLPHFREMEDKPIQPQLWRGLLLPIPVLPICSIDSHVQTPRALLHRTEPGLITQAGAYIIETFNQV